MVRRSPRSSSSRPTDDRALAGCSGTPRGQGRWLQPAGDPRRRDAERPDLHRDGLDRIHGQRSRTAGGRPKFDRQRLLDHQPRVHPRWRHGARERIRQEPDELDRLHHDHGPGGPGGRRLDQVQDDRPGRQRRPLLVPAGQRRRDEDDCQERLGLHLADSPGRQREVDGPARPDDDRDDRRDRDADVPGLPQALVGRTVRHIHRNEVGQSLVIVLSLITLLFLLGSSLAVHASVALRTTRTSAGQGDEFYAADAATELGVWWQRNGKAGNPPVQTINGITTSTTITSTPGAGGTCPADAKPLWLSGFESGKLSQNNGGFYIVSGASSGVLDAVSSPVHTGSYSMRIHPTINGSHYAQVQTP